MRMNIGIGSFYCSQKRNPQPATFLKFTFFVDGVGEGMEKAGSLFVGLPLVYLVDLFTEELYKDLNYMFRLILLFSEQNIIY